MKELSIEEKAKAYDEAKARMSKAYNDNRCTLGFMNEIFPELKESEDERIRKELLEHCKNQAKPYIQTGNKYPQIQSWIAWLEKQGEQEKSTKEKLMALSDGKQHLGWLDDADKVIDTNQKPVEWSKEDLVRIENCISLIGKTGVGEVKWLQSLKDRVLPQLNQERKPSEEQMKALLDTINYITGPEVRSHLSTLYEQLREITK